MPTSRRNFLKLAGITVGLATFGGGRTIIAAPSSDEVPDEYLQEKKETFETIYGQDTSPEQVIEAALGSTRPTALHTDDHLYKEGDVLIPGLWAQEAVVILEESMTIGNLIRREFSNEVGAYGDCVNVIVPNQFDVARKRLPSTVGEDLATYENAVIPLNQQMYTQFIIKDGEYTQSFSNLVDIFIRPSMIAIGSCIDMLILEHLVRLKVANVIDINPRNSVGQCGFAVGKRPRDIMLGARTHLNENKCFLQGRNAIIPVPWEAGLLKFEPDLARLDENVLGKNRTRDGFRLLGFNTFTNGTLKEGIAFHKDAALLVNRPLALPPDFSGTRSAREQTDGLSMRCVMQYDPRHAGTRVTFDTLMGMGVLKKSLICRMSQHKQGVNVFGTSKQM